MISKEIEYGTLALSQSSYVKRIVNVFRMNEARAITTLVATHFKLSAVKGELAEEKAKFMKKIPYSNVVGSLMYAMIGTRPDIAYGVSLVSRFMSKLAKLHCRQSNGY